MLTRQNRRSITQRDRRRSVEPLEARQLLTTFSVSNLLDGPVTGPGELPGSLRQAIFDANSASGPDVIEFDEGLRGTIELQAGQLPVTDVVAIVGPADRGISISGNHETRVFLVNQTSLSISDLAVVDGRASDFPVPLPPDAPPMSMGAGVLSLSSSVALTRTDFSGHRTSDGALGAGAAVGSVFGSSLDIEQSTFTDNVAFGFGLGVGGAILNDAASSMTVRNSVFANNDTQTTLGGDPENLFVGVSGGGAIMTAGGSTTRIYSTDFIANRSTGATGIRGLEDGAHGLAAGSGLGGAMGATGTTLIGIPARSTLYVADSTFRENIVSGGRGGDGAADGDGGTGGFANGSALNVFDNIDATIVRSLFVGNQSIAGRGGDGGSGGNGGSGTDFTGAAILVSGADLVLVNSDVRDNFSSGGSGGNGGEGGHGGNASLAVSGGVVVTTSPNSPSLPATAHIVSTSFVDNVAIGGDGGAGGSGDTLAGTAGPARGGAVHVDAGENLADGNQGPVSFVSINNTILGNVATGGSGELGGPAMGGGISGVENSVGERPFIKIRNTTISGNSAVGGVGVTQGGHGEGGGIFSEASMDIGSRDLQRVAGNSSDGCQDAFLDGLCVERDVATNGREGLASRALVGDFNGDGTVGAEDSVLLDQAIGQLTNDLVFDLNADDSVNSADSQLLSRLLGAKPGDANLSGGVDFADFLVVAEHFGKPRVTWSQGDFNGDEVVDFADFLILSEGFGS